LFKLNVWFSLIRVVKNNRLSLKKAVVLPSNQTKSRHKGRQRCAETQASILSATIELLEQRFLRDVTADAIAQRAGVSKATIYKWWPNKSLVALDAFLSRMQRAVETPDTGSAQKDFIEQIKSLLRFFSSPYGRIYAQFMAEGQSDLAFRDEFRERFLKARRDEIRVIWQRGVERGDIRKDIDGDIALDLIYGPIIFRLLTGHSPLNEIEAKAIVATAFRGLAK
jgi:AcrR family transcriptional regulator